MSLAAALGRPGVLHAPGAFDALSAKLAAAAGFDALYCSGAATAAVVLGEPDLGFAGLAEMAAQAGVVARAGGLPVIADADTGYGNPLHAARAIRRFEQAGVAAIQLEDQVYPKRCGHMTGKAVVPAAEMVAKVAAACEARDACLVIARTDALSVEGPDAAVERAGAYAAAGADLVLVEGTCDPALLRRAADAAGVGLVVNASEAAGSVDLPGDEVLAEAGCALVIHPVTALLAAAAAVRDAMAALRRGEQPVPACDWNDLTALLGLEQALADEARFAGG